MKKAFLGVFVGMFFAQAVMYGGQAAESKYQQKDGVKSAPAQNEPKLLVFSTEKRIFSPYSVKANPSYYKAFLEQRHSEGQAAIKYQSAGESTITIYELKQGSNPSVLFVCIDKADTNVLGQLTVLKRKRPGSPCYLNLPDPETVIKDLRNSRNAKVAYKFSDGYWGCEITVYANGLEQYVCIQDNSRTWTPGNYYEMGKVRGREIMDVEIAYMPITVGPTLRKIYGELKSLKCQNDLRDNCIRGIFDIVQTYPKFQWDEVGNKTKIDGRGRFTKDPEQLWPKGNYGAMGECRAYELKKAIRVYNNGVVPDIIHYINWEYGETLRTAGQEEADKYAYGVNNEMMRPVPPRNIIPWGDKGD